MPVRIVWQGCQQTGVFAAEITVCQRFKANRQQQGGPPPLNVQLFDNIAKFCQDHAIQLGAGPVGTALPQVFRHRRRGDVPLPTGIQRLIQPDKAFAAIDQGAKTNTDIGFAQLYFPGFALLRPQNGRVETGNQPFKGADFVQPLEILNRQHRRLDGNQLPARQFAKQLVDQIIGNRPGPLQRFLTGGISKQQRKMPIIQRHENIMSAQLAANVGFGDFYNIFTDFAPSLLIACLDLIKPDDLDAAGNKVFKGFPIGFSEGAQKACRFANFVMLHFAGSRIRLYIAGPAALIVEIGADLRRIFRTTVGPSHVFRYNHPIHIPMGVFSRIIIADQSI